MSVHDKETIGAGNAVQIRYDSFSDKDVGSRITGHETDMHNSGT